MLALNQVFAVPNAVLQNVDKLGEDELLTDISGHVLNHLNVLLLTEVSEFFEEELIFVSLFSQLVFLLSHHVL